MIWNANNVDIIIDQKEYIDTALVPLVLIEGESMNMKRSASAAEFLMNLTTFIESQFKGRIVQFPPFSYTASADKVRLVEEWKLEFAKMPFKHYIFLTTDSSWTSNNILSDALYLPAIPLENMDKSVKQAVLQDQLRQIVPILSSRWTSN